MSKRKRVKQLKTSHHHRRPVSLNGGDEPGNISMVTEKAHQSWHHIVANHTPQEIAKIITDVWLDPAWKMIAVRC